MQRAAKLVARVPTAIVRSTRVAVNTRPLIAAAAVLPAMAWPPVPALMLSTTTVRPGNAGPTDVTELLDAEDEDTTRFKRGGNVDRGPPIAQRARSGPAAGGESARGTDRPFRTGGGGDRRGDGGARFSRPGDRDQQRGPGGPRGGPGGGPGSSRDRRDGGDSRRQDGGAAAQAADAAAAAAAAAAPAPYTGAKQDVLVDRFGNAVPLDGADAAAAASASVAPLDAKKAAANSVLLRRALRVTMDDRQLDTLARSLAVQREETPETLSHGPAVPSALGGAPRNAFTARRGDDYRQGEDPLAVPGALPFDVSAVTLSSNMSFSAAPGAGNLDRKAVLTARLGQLGLTPAEQAYVRLIAGPRYTPRTDVLKIASEKHIDAAANRREVVERLAALVHAAKQLLAAHGPATVVKSKPAYTH